MDVVKPNTDYGRVDLRFEVLGAPRAWYGDKEIRLGPPMQQAVAVYLATHANRVVPQRELIEAIWGDGRPHVAADSVYKYVSKLRRLLDPDRAPRAASDVLVSRDTGYLLRLGPDALDTTGFAHAIAAARDLREAGDIAAALTQLETGLRFWRGDALAGLPSGPFVLGERKRLREQQIAAEQQRGECLLQLGRYADAITSLTRLVDAFPRRQALRALLMRALYADGRRDDALAVFARLEPQRRTPELLELGKRIASGDPALTEPQQTTPRTVDQLPRDIRAFTGRVDELARLEKLLDTPEETPIAAIDGTAGIGKTALALRFAHQVADRFPEGRLYLNLRGVDPTPLQPLDALGQLLRSIGIDTAELPEDQDERAAFYRSVVAGKRLLLLLDNAQSSEQVRPLLPGAGECLVIVTSRACMSGLVAHDDAERIPVNALDDEQSLALIARIVGPERVDAEPDQAQRLAKLCGQFPLALRIAAANLDASPGRSMADFCTDLESGDRISALAVAGDELAGVQAAFDQSYDALSPGAQGLFRRLSVIPGPDFPADAATALIDEPADPLLTELATVNMVDSHLPGRCRLHDLLRAYGQRRANDDDSTAVDRLIDWYVAEARAANKAVSPYFVILRDDLPPAHTTHASAQAASEWLSGEQENIVAVVRDVLVRPLGPATWRSANAFGYTLRRVGEHSLLRTLIEAGLQAARSAGNDLAIAAMLCTVGTHDQLLSKNLEALDPLHEALTIVQGTSWTELEGAIENSLAEVNTRLGRLADAEAHALRSIDLDRELGSVIAEAQDLIQLSAVQHMQGNVRGCLASNEAAVALAREHDAPYVASDALGNIGLLQIHFGELDSAESALTEAIGLSRDIGNSDTESFANSLLSRIYLIRGDSQRAKTAALEAIGLASTAETPAYVAIAAYYDARVAFAERDPSARQRCLEAVSLARTDGDSGSIIVALGLFVELEAADGNPAAALDVAKTLAEECVGVPKAERHAHLGFARARLAAGECVDALRDARQAIGCHADAEDRIGEAEATICAGLAARGAGDSAAAQEHLDRAREMYAAMGAAQMSVTGLVPGGTDPD